MADTNDTFRTYRRRITIAEMRPYEPGEDLSGVSVSEEDAPPREGDMIARNPDNHADQWLVSKEYFEANFQPNPID